MKEAANEMWGMVPLKARYGMFFFLGILVLGALWMTSCTSISGFIKNYPDDNIVEEYTEDIIKDQTGIDIDLTPRTPESPRR
jgi:hypothetical protein